MCVTICGRFCPEEGVVASYNNRIPAKYTTNCDAHLAEVLFLNTFCGRKEKLNYFSR